MKHKFNFIIITFSFEFTSIGKLYDTYKLFPVQVVYLVDYIVLNHFCYLQTNELLSNE